MTTKTLIQDMLDHVTSECTAIDADSRYDEMLDDCYSFEKVGGIFANMSPSRVLRECDPVAYRCGMNDWLDSEQYVEIDSDYYDQRDAEKAKDDYIEEMEGRESGLEEEIEELEVEDPGRGMNEEETAAEILSLTTQLDILRRQIKEVRNHSF